MNPFLHGGNKHSQGVRSGFVQPSTVFAFPNKLQTSWPMLHFLTSGPANNGQVDLDFFEQVDPVSCFISFFLGGGLFQVNYKREGAASLLLLRPLIDEFPANMGFMAFGRFVFSRTWGSGCRNGPNLQFRSSSNHHQKG